MTSSSTALTVTANGIPYGTSRGTVGSTPRKISIDLVLPVLGAAHVTLTLRDSGIGALVVCTEAARHVAAWTGTKIVGAYRLCDEDRLALVDLLERTVAGFLPN